MELLVERKQIWIAEIVDIVGQTVMMTARQYH
jgi:hypothetical protein